MDGNFHASIAHPVPTYEVESLGHVEGNHVPPGSGGPVMDGMLRVAGLVIGLVHLKNTRLIPIIHENWKNESNEEMNK